MKDILKVGALYFVAAVSSIAGIAVGCKIGEKLLDSKSSTISLKKES